MADQASHATLHFKTDFRQLGGLAGSGLAANDHHLMRLYRARDLGAAQHHRQFVRIGRHRQIRATGFNIVGHASIHLGAVKDALAPQASRGLSRDSGTIRQPASGFHIRIQAVGAGDSGLRQYMPCHCC